MFSFGRFHTSPTRSCASWRWRGRTPISGVLLRPLKPMEKEIEMATSRPRPQVMRLSEAAAQRIQDVIGKAGRPLVGVRVGVKNGGCAGMSYTMEYADTVNPLDEVVEDRGVRLLIDPKAVLFLLGTEM